jgi:hypothetical protein
MALVFSTPSTGFLIPLLCLGTSCMRIQFHSVKLYLHCIKSLTSNVKCSFGINQTKETICMDLVCVWFPFVLKSQIMVINLIYLENKSVS